MLQNKSEDVHGWQGTRQCTPVVPAGTEGEGPFGLLPAISAAQQVDRQLSTAQAGASPSEASSLASP